MVDINRLHETVINKPSGRNTGKTFATIYELIGAIQTTELKNIVCFIKTYSYLDYLFYNIIDEMVKNGIKVEPCTPRPSLHVTYEQQSIKIHFISTASKDYHRYLRRMHKYISINFIDY